MAEEIYDLGDDPGKKKNRTLWIVLGILAVIVICCICLMILSAIIIGIVSYSTATLINFSPISGLI